MLVKIFVFLTFIGLASSRQHHQSSPRAFSTDPDFTCPVTQVWCYSKDWNAVEGDDCACPREDDGTCYHFFDTNLYQMDPSDCTIGCVDEECLYGPRDPTDCTCPEQIPQVDYFCWLGDYWGMTGDESNCQTWTCEDPCFSGYIKEDCACRLPLCPTEGELCWDQTTIQGPDCICPQQSSEPISEWTKWEWQDNDSVDSCKSECVSNPQIIGDLSVDRASCKFKKTAGLKKVLGKVNLSQRKRTISWENCENQICANGVEQFSKVRLEKSSNLKKMPTPCSEDSDFDYGLSVHQSPVSGKVCPVDDPFQVDGQLQKLPNFDSTIRNPDAESQKCQAKFQRQNLDHIKKLNDENDVASSIVGRSLSLTKQGQNGDSSGVSCCLIEAQAQKARK